MTEDRDDSADDTINELQGRTQNWLNLTNREKIMEKKISLRELWDIKKIQHTYIVRISKGEKRVKLKEF